MIVGSVEAFTPAFLSGKQIRFWNTSLPLETYVTALAVAAASRRSGVARALMQSVEELAWLAGEDTVSLQVDAANVVAVSLYENLGYQTFGQDSALTTPSSNPLISSVFFGGAMQRSLIVMQKTRPRPATESRPQRQELTRRQRISSRLRSILQSVLQRGRRE